MISLSGKAARLHRVVSSSSLLLGSRIACSLTGRMADLHSVDMGSSPIRSNCLNFSL
jgi:hypothetical protein